MHGFGAIVGGALGQRVQYTELTAGGQAQADREYAMWEAEQAHNQAAAEMAMTEQDRRDRHGENAINV